MEIKRRTQEERSAATRDALISAARKLWGLRGYAEVGTPEIATAARASTRGAMYHQFADKAALFRDVVGGGGAGRDGPDGHHGGRRRERRRPPM